MSALEREVAVDFVPCPGPDCTNIPTTGDRFCDVCGTWLGVDGEKPPTTGPLQKAILSTGALKLVTIIEKAESSLNDLCK